MNRKTFLKALGSVAMLPAWPRSLRAGTPYYRRRPTDADWPSSAAWKNLNDAVGGNLIRVDFPLNLLKSDPKGSAAAELKKNVKNPYYIGDQPGLTETFGWLDAWATKPSVYAVAARDVNDIVHAVNFARENNLRLAIKGRGHSYQGTSNAPDSLLIWTRHMHNIEIHPAFVPQGCEGKIAPQRAMTVGAGTFGAQAYDAATTKAGMYVQGGGCLTVGLAGLIQGGGFGSFSKHYGTAAGSLLEAEVVTADGQIRIANACTNADLFWALKGGGGGTFGVVSKLTIKMHDLPEYFASVSFNVSATSDEAFRRLVRYFVAFYRKNLFNHHWGEQVRFRRDNTLEVAMLAHGLDTAAARNVWQPFLDWIGSSRDYSIGFPKTIAAIPARHFWDSAWVDKHWPELALPNPNSNPFIGAVDWTLGHVVPDPVLQFDPRAGHESNAWWKGNTEEAGWYIWAYQSLWMPQSLLEDDEQQRLADTLFAASRHNGLSLHFNKGLAGAPPEAITAARDTATNPSVLTAFALVIVANGEDLTYPGIPGHEPSVAKGRQSAARIEACMKELRKIAPDGGAYVSESDYFEKDFQRSYWGNNYPRLAAIKRKYDPEGLFIVHNGVGSEEWSADGFRRF